MRSRRECRAERDRDRDREITWGREGERRDMRADHRTGERERDLIVALGVASTCLIYREILGTEKQDKQES